LPNASRSAASSESIKGSISQEPDGEADVGRAEESQRGLLQIEPVRKLPEAVRWRRNAGVASDYRQIDCSQAARTDPAEPHAEGSALGFPPRDPPRRVPFAKPNRKGGMTMNMRDLIPWNRGRDVAAYRGEQANPLLMLHREMNRMFDDVFRGFDVAPFGSGRPFERALGWPDIEVSETDKQIKVTADLPGLEEKDIGVELANGVLSIKGEKKAETEDKERLFSERYYGRFERRIPVDDVEADKVNASFKSGVLTVTLPKSSKAQEKSKRITINAR